MPRARNREGHVLAAAESRLAAGRRARARAVRRESLAETHHVESSVVHDGGAPAVPRPARAARTAVGNRVVHDVQQTAVHDEVQVVAVAHAVGLRAHQKRSSLVRVRGQTQRGDLRVRQRHASVLRRARRVHGYDRGDPAAVGGAHHELALDEERLETARARRGRGRVRSGAGGRYSKYRRVEADALLLARRRSAARRTRLIPAI
mmetsp:Transcript_13438/g.56420  ORF Transcript_13438/g.56420 Transcript_13438/m.56420 type:complete len:205 (+) Transcript_13438:3204-3818(+)